MPLSEGAGRGRPTMCSPAFCALRTRQPVVASTPVDASPRFGPGLGETLAGCVSQWTCVASLRWRIRFQPAPRHALPFRDFLASLAGLGPGNTGASTAWWPCWLLHRAQCRGLHALSHPWTVPQVSLLSNWCRPRSRP
jgi:hypothetical protein